jgi:hypothetical protein
LIKRTLSGSPFIAPALTRLRKMLVSAVHAFAFEQMPLFTKRGSKVTGNMAANCSLKRTAGVGLR